MGTLFPPRRQVCNDCGAGEYEDTACSAVAGAFVQRTCQPVEPGFYSSNGENTKTACDDGTFTSAPGSAKCALCSSCGAGEHEATPCTSSADRTCAAVDEEQYSADGDNAQRPCFNRECPDGTFRVGTCDPATGLGFQCEVGGGSVRGWVL